MRTLSSIATFLLLSAFSPASIAHGHYDIPPWIVIFYPFMYLLTHPYILALVLILLCVLVVFVRSLKRKGIIGPKAPTYNWVCPSCEEVNQANSAVCCKCSKKVI